MLKYVLGGTNRILIEYGLIVQNINYIVIYWMRVTLNICQHISLGSIVSFWFYNQIIIIINYNHNDFITATIVNCEKFSIFLIQNKSYFFSQI